MKKITGIVCILGMFLLLCIAGCYTPSPLYGTWSDNLGNKIMFSDDNTFTATVVIAGEQQNINGSYNVADNVISLSTSDSTIVTEWDLRGSILYLQWTASVAGGDTEIINLSLYHTS